MEIKTIKKNLKKELSPFRYDHSIRVAKEAKKLAKHYQINENKAYLTGLIHDMAKELTEEENIEWIKKGKQSNDLQKEECKNIKHADIGAVIAKEEYNLDDDICNAIKYHTVGRVGMNDFEKIVFLSDKIEPKTRNAEFRNMILNELDKNNGLNRAVLLCFKTTIKSLLDRNLPICKSSINTYNYILSTVIEKK